MTRFMVLDLFCSLIDAVTCDIHIFLGICALTFTFFFFFVLCLCAGDICFLALIFMFKDYKLFCFYSCTSFGSIDGKIAELLKSALLWNPLVGPT